MRIAEANKKLDQVLSALYPEREAQQIKRSFWEDLFSIRGGIDRVLHTREIAVFDNAVEKIKAMMPIQYVTGVTYFYDLKLQVNECVLIPRPETEELLALFLSENKNCPVARILDVGTGSGCIPIQIKKKCPHFQVDALDVSSEALKVAKANAEKNESKINLFKLNFLDEGEWENLASYDFVISNPPYIPTSEKSLMSESTLRFEPDLALFAEDEKGVIFYDKLAAFGQIKLKDGGKMYLECNEYNAADIVDIFKEAGYYEVRLVQDMQGKDRMLVARK